MPGLPIGSIVAIDLETTGLDPETDRVVEVGALRFGPDGRNLGHFSRLVQPGRPMNPSAERIHGISDAMLAEADPAEVVLPAFFDWIASDPPQFLLAHHARFDASFLGRELVRIGLDLPDLQVTDTLALSRRRLPQARTHRLDALAEALGIDAGPAHRALADCERVRGLWLALDGQQGPFVSYPIFDPIREEAVPTGWAPLLDAIAGGRRVRISYQGGSRGAGLREITPRRVIHKGGAAYLVAFCHLERFEKSFRLDRVSLSDLIDPPKPVA